MALDLLNPDPASLIEQVKPQGSRNFGCNRTSRAVTGTQSSNFSNDIP
ncbi:MAG TPA: hypothetical protein VIY08_13675 [Candidatus Nitrosocosmicus sp.]